MRYIVEIPCGTEAKEMSSKTHRNGRKSPSRKVDVESLYLRFLKAFYEDEDHEKARKIAPRLQKALTASPGHEGSIRAEEIRSLIAELEGDLVEAARCREAEIRKILELHALSVNTPGWNYVAKRYDFSDVGDRLDLLAMLYDRLGDTGTGDRDIAGIEGIQPVASNSLRWPGLAG